MAIFYVSTFECKGLSSDIKPLDAPEGMVFWELDSQKIYIFQAGQWKEIKAGAGIWSPSATEALTNKTIVLNQNTVKTTLGNLGLFGFNSTGNFTFIPIGSANRYLKVNATGNGFEFGDPSVTGTWSPSSTETLTNKTLAAEANTIKANTPAAGQILLDNGTKFVPIPKGSIGQALKVKSDGTVGWDTDQTGSSAFSGLPSLSGYHEGYFYPWSDFNTSYIEAHGVLRNEIYYEGYVSDTAPTYHINSSRGRYINFNSASSSSYHQFKTNYIFMRDLYSYFLCKFRLTTTSTSNMLMGFMENHPTQYSSETVFNGYDCLAFGKLTGLSNWRIFHNAATATATTVVTGTAADTNPHTIELVFEPNNNRIGWKLDNVGGTAWNYISTNIPRSGFTLAQFISLNGTSTSQNNLEIYGWEAKNKNMF